MTSNPGWEQVYLPFGLPLAASSAVAALPVAAVLLLLGGLRRPAWLAGSIGLAVSLATALVCYRMPPVLAVGAMTYGIAFGLFPICWIVFWAIALFRLTTITGKFTVIRASIASVTQDAPSQALLVAFAFGAFLEGAAGFGTPVAIASAMLVSLGFSPVRAAAICLLANTAPVAFGSIGTPLLTLAATTGLPLLRLSAAVAAICAPVAVLVPAYMVAAMGGWRMLRSALVPCVVTGAIFGGTQFVVGTYVGPALTDILASMLAMAALVVVCRVRSDTSSDHAMQRSFRDAAEAVAPATDEVATVQLSTRALAAAWTPYLCLVVFVLLWSVLPVQRILAIATRSVPWPMLHDHVLRVPPVVANAQPYHALYLFNLLAAAGTACMGAVLCSALLLRVPLRSCRDLLVATAKQLALPAVTVVSVIGMAFVMNYSGATATLGLAFAATGKLFPFFSALLGWTGVFLTGSDTSANALFGSLQVVTAERLHLSPVLMSAANSSGGVVGKMISLQTIVVAAAATGMDDCSQSRLFRLMVRHSLVLIALVSGIALLYAHLHLF